MNTPCNPASVPKSPVEVLYGPWHGQAGVLQEPLSAGEWLVQLLQPDQYGAVLLALQPWQFRQL
ncbi:hypothetical protein [Candidatus Cyanaurora vandensis]|uniref:hypothetical protein n=1 Tax=Candidatus Cyanaurora vandensis TaxID=2714958 RepID=UPI00257F5FF2|nr:hypothetical protein [Candidatus Cyanaurora vandensis]